MESFVLEPRERGASRTADASDPERGASRTADAPEAEAEAAWEALLAFERAERAALQQQHTEALEALAFELADRDNATDKMQELRHKCAQAMDDLAYEKDRVSKLEHFQRGAEVIQVSGFRPTTYTLFPVI